MSVPSSHASNKPSLTKTNSRALPCPRLSLAAPAWLRCFPQAPWGSPPTFFLQDILPLIPSHSQFTIQTNKPCHWVLATSGKGWHTALAMNWKSKCSPQQQKHCMTLGMSVAPSLQVSCWRGMQSATTSSYQAASLIHSHIRARCNHQHWSCCPDNSLVQAFGKAIEPNPSTR